jgi:hypothetical protein
MLDDLERLRARGWATEQLHRPCRVTGVGRYPVFAEEDHRTCHFSHDPKEKGFQLSDSRLDMDADQRVQKGYESCTIFGVWCEQSCRK